MTLKLRSQMLCRIVFPTALLLSLIVIISMSILWPNISNWTGRVQDHIVTEEMINLIVRAKNQQIKGSTFFGEIKNEVDHMASYAMSIYHNEFNISNYYPNYFTVTQIPPNGLDQNGENRDYSLWFNKFDSDPLNNIHLQNSSIMDNVWRSMISGNENYLGLYIGFEEATFRHLPFMTLPSYQTNEYTCITNNQLVIGYDPRCRGWYDLARTDTSKTHFTEPYIDASSGIVLISASKAILDKSGSLIGVVAVDLSMDNINSFVLSDRVLENGYTYLVDSNGQLIVYPNLKRDRVYTLSEKEFPDLAIDANNFMNNIFPEMVSSDSGQTNFTKDNTEWTITYAKINTTGYIVAMVVPTTDITKGTRDIKDGSNNGLIIALIVMLVFGLFGIMLYTILSIRISNKIARSVNNVTNIFTNVGEDHLDEQMGNTSGNSKIRELDDIERKATQLIEAVRFANMHIQKGNAQDAIVHLEAVQRILEEYDNQIGLGVVFNNKAYAYKLLKNLNNAHINMTLAIDNAQELYEGEESFDNAKQFFLIKLAMRYMGLAMIFSDLDEVYKAEEAFEKSIELNDQADNSFGKVKTLGNWGLFYMQIDDYKSAFDKFNESYQIAILRYNNNKNNTNKKSLYVATYNLAHFFYKSKDYVQANKYIAEAWLLSSTGNEQRKCLTIRAKILGDTDRENKMTAICREFNISQGAKHVTFVLDISGSMRGSRLNTCKEAMKTVVNNFMDDLDTISYLTFSNSSVWVFEDYKVGERKRTIIKKINNTKSNGGTAFYDAIHTACDKITNKNSNGYQWIVALTDGEDGMSKKTLDSVCHKVRNNGFNVIVIGAMLKDKYKDQIKKIADASEQGMFISADNIQEITDAFTEAAEIINEGQMALEDL